MNELLPGILQKRKNRAIAIIMGVKERDVDKHLDAMTANKLRKVVLDQFNDFYDLCLDVMTSLDNGEVVLNEEWLTKLDELHSAFVKNGAGRA